MTRLHGLRASVLVLIFASVGCNCSPPPAPGAPPTGSVVTATAMSLAPGGSGEHPAVALSPEPGPRNVILLLSDGTAPEAWTLARWVKGQPLAVDPILTGAIRTYGADSIITDSAPGATAYATAHKGTDKAISVGPFHTTIDAAKSSSAPAFVPLPTLLEGARHNGFATGLIATSNIQHATPAAFSAHVRDRNLYTEIAEQQVYQGIDVVLSGGKDYLLPTSVPGGKRTDGENLVQTLGTLGYRVVERRKDLLSAPNGKLFGIFAHDDLSFEIDRARYGKDQPSLAEMTEQAIRRLSTSIAGKQKGFFLFVEGSKVDWAAHDNDPIGVVSDLLAFDAAVGKALDFARSNSHSQVIVVADHATGGLSIGSNAEPHYSQTDDDAVIGPLRKAKISAKMLSQVLGELGPSGPIAATLANEWAITDLAPSELDELKQALTNRQNLMPLLSRIISTRAGIGWTTKGHTGADPYLFAYGPGHPQGLVENVVIGQEIASFLGFSLDQLQTTLFADLNVAFANAGYTVILDHSPQQGGQLVVAKGSKRATMPFSKNLLIVDGKPLTLPGIVVYADKLEHVFGPIKAVELMR